MPTGALALSGPTGELPTGSGIQIPFDGHVIWLSRWCVIAIVIVATHIDEDFFMPLESGFRTNRREGSGGHRGVPIPELVEDFPACTDWVIYYLNAIVITYGDHRLPD